MSGNVGPGGDGGVSVEWVDALREVLGRHSTSADDVEAWITYVLTGRGEGALPGRKLWRAPTASDVVVVRGVVDVPCEVVLRWCRVMSEQDDPGVPAYWLPEVLGYVRRVQGLPGVGGPWWRYDWLEQVLEQEGVPPEGFVEWLVGREWRWWPWAPGTTAVLDGFAAGVSRHLDVVRARVTQGGIEDRVRGLEMVDLWGDVMLERLAPEVVAAATGSSRTLQKVAEPLVGRCGRAAVEPLRRVAVQGASSARWAALRLLFEHGADEDRLWAARTAGADRVARVRALAEEWAQRGAEDVVIEVPPRPVIDWRVEVTPERRRVLEELWDAAEHTADRVNEWNLLQRVTQASLARPLTDEHLQAVIDDLEAGRLGEPLLGEALGWTPEHRNALILSMRSVPGLELLGVPGVLLLWYGLGFTSHGLNEQLDRFARGDAPTGYPTLVELWAMLEDLGVPDVQPPASAWTWYVNTTRLRPRPDEEVAAFVATHLDAVLEALTTSPQRRNWSLKLVYRALGTLPRLPARVADVLYEAALTGPHRLVAQEALRSDPGRVRRASAALGYGTAKVRVEAARWLARIGDVAAVGPLQEALARERNELRKRVLLDALEALGHPVDRDGTAAGSVGTGHV